MTGTIGGNIGRSAGSFEGKITEGLLKQFAGGNRRSRKSSKSLCMAAGAAAMASLCALSSAQSAHGQSVTVFNDTFGSSTLNQTLTASNVTSTSTSYDGASTKNMTTAISSGDLKLAYSSSSGAGEYETLFTQSPITLSVEGSKRLRRMQRSKPLPVPYCRFPGDYADLGLFNSNGNVTASPSVVPYTNLSSTGLSSTTTEATGGVQNWVGYAGTVSATGGNTNNNFFRGAQTGSTQQINQDLVLGGVASTSAQTSLGGTTTASYVAVIGDTYTQDVTISLNASGSLTMTTSLYLNTGSGAGTMGILEESTTANTPVASSSALFNATFDGLGIGVRGGTQQVDYSNVTVSYVAAPEPASLGLLGGAMTMLLRRRGRRPQSAKPIA